MFLFELERKLRRCNPRIYVKSGGRATNEDGVKLAGIYLRQTRRRDFGRHAQSQAVERMRAAEAGWVDTLLTHSPTPEVPEFERLTADDSKIGLKGWRSIVKDCVIKGAFSWEQAKKVFGRSIGEFDWDRMNYLEKEAKLKADLEPSKKGLIL